MGGPKERRGDTGHEKEVMAGAAVGGLFAIMPLKHNGARPLH